MNATRFFRFSYYIRESNDASRRLHHLRDGDAFAEIATLLSSKGLEYGGILFNYPSRNRIGRQVDSSFLKNSDLLVLTTRPPINGDEEQEANRHVDRSYSTLEREVLEAICAYFDKALRKRVKLNKLYAGELNGKFKNRADIIFNQTYGAHVVKFRQYGTRQTWHKPKVDITTVFYLVLTPPVPRLNGARILASFGMGGTETLIWSHILRTSYWKKLGLDVNEPRMLMVEVENNIGRLSEIVDIGFIDRLMARQLAPQTVLLNTKLQPKF
jgi:hypothetical protein